MKKIQAHLFIILLLFLLSCNNHHLKKHIEYSKVTGNKMCEGMLTNDDKETGLWVYYNESGATEEEGRYENGFKIGLWEFNYDSVRAKMEWSKYTCDTAIGLVVSIPSFFKTSENKKDISLYAENPDEPFEDIYFIIHDKNTKLNIDTLNKLALEQVKSNTQILEYSIEKAANDFGEFYSNYYVVKSDKSDKVWVLYAYIANNDNVIFDITYKTEYNFPTLKKMVFSNILFHSFYKGSHLLSPKSVIRKIYSEGQ